MEKLSTMLSKEQLELVKKEFRAMPNQRPFQVKDGAMLRLLNQIGNTRYYLELGTTHQWRFTYNRGKIVKVERDPCFFAQT